MYNRAKLAVAAFHNIRAAATAHGQPAAPEEVMESGSDVCSICQVWRPTGSKLVSEAVGCSAFNHAHSMRRDMCHGSCLWSCQIGAPSLVLVAAAISFFCTSS